MFGKMKKIQEKIPVFAWGVIRATAPLTKWCPICLHKKLAILLYPNQSELLNKRSVLVSKGPNENKLLLQTFNGND